MKLTIAGYHITIERTTTQTAAQPRLPARYDLDALGWLIAGECDATLAGGKPMPDGIEYVIRPNTSIARTLDMARFVRMSAWVLQASQSGAHVVVRARPAAEEVA